MKVFISWSGARSHAVAKVLKDWIKCVLHATQPWLSSEDIDRGALWNAQINQQLQKTTVGILCLTQENLEKPWVLFEAGALAKGLSQNLVCPLLVDLNASDVAPPLSQFNLTLPNKDGIRKLVSTLNKLLPDSSRLEENTLNRSFETFWKQFEIDFTAALDANPVGRTVLQVSDVLQQILEILRNLSSKSGHENETGNGGRASMVSALTEAMNTLASIIGENAKANQVTNQKLDVILDEIRGKWR